MNKTQLVRVDRKICTIYIIFWEHVDLKRPTIWIPLKNPLPVVFVALNPSYRTACYSSLDRSNRIKFSKKILLYRFVEKAFPCGPS